MICDFCESPLSDIEPSTIATLQSLTCPTCAMVRLIGPAKETREEPANEFAESLISTTTTVSFARGASGRAGILYGWGAPQDWGSWSVADWAAFEVPTPISSVALAFELGYRAPGHVSNRRPLSFDIYAQERFCGSAIAFDPGDQTLKGRLPLSSAASGGRVVFELYQKALGNDLPSAENRIGMGLMSCTIRPIET